jgi:hypothetical protein
MYTVVDRPTPPFGCSTVGVVTTLFTIPGAASHVVFQLSHDDRCWPQAPYPRDARDQRTHSPATMCARG